VTADPNPGVTLVRVRSSTCPVLARDSDQFLRVFEFVPAQARPPRGEQLRDASEQHGKGHLAEGPAGSVQARKKR